MQSRFCGCTGCASCDPGDIFAPWEERMREVREKIRSEEIEREQRRLERIEAASSSRASTSTSSSSSTSASSSRSKNKSSSSSSSRSYDSDSDDD